MIEFRSLLPGGDPLTAAQALDEVDFAALAPDGRPYVALNMIASLDGRAARDGRSGGLGSAADRELFHQLRVHADAVMAGAGTVRVEGYGPIVRDPALRDLRTARGEPPQPLGVIVSHSLKLDPELPLLADPASEVAVLTDDPRAELPPCNAAVSYVRGDGLPAQLRELRERHGVRSIVCEGGPMLAGALFADGLVDDLFLSISPLVLGGAEPTTIVSGPPMSTELELRWLLEHESHLFARYVVS